jgi:hypothetical protein
MAVDATPRPVSGEIMTSPRRSRAPNVTGTFIEAEVISEAPVSMTPVFQSPQPQALGLTMLSGAEQGTAARRAGALFWTAGLALALSAFWISGGYALAPANIAASAASLKIAHVETQLETKAGRTTLAVDGEVHNGSQSGQSVPPIGIAVTANDGTITRYTLSTNANAIAAGDIYLFSSRLRVPSGQVKSVAVTLQPVE